MSDVSQGPGWWLASDGKWYPPSETEAPPAPGWWLAADGKWYPPSETETPPAPGWWLAADGKWYPPEPDPEPLPAREIDAEPLPARGTESAPALAETVEPVAAEAPEPVAAQVEAPAAEVPAPEPVPEPAVEPEVEPAADVEPAPPREAVPAAAHHDLDRHRPARRTDLIEAAEETTPVGTQANSLPANASEQIRRRDEASRLDAKTQSQARALAAMRALRDLDDERGPAPAAASPANGHRARRPARATAAAAPARAIASQPVTKPAPAAPAAPPSPPPAAPVAGPEPAAASAAPLATPSESTPAADAPPPGPDELLAELRTSPLGADLDHIGDRLLVFGDRVELRDRADHLRQMLAGEDITDVVVQRKFTGAVLTVEAGTGDVIITRGLKPEQADDAKVLIHKYTRRGRPAEPRQRVSSDPLAALGAPLSSSADAVAAAANRLAILNRDRLNEADLLRKLADLHRAGVLRDDEFEAKVALVGRLVRGETIVVS